MVGYADDVAVIVEGRRAEDIKDQAEYCISKITSNLSGLGLRLAEQKT